MTVRDRALRRTGWTLILLLLMSVVVPGVARAQGAAAPPTINSGDVAWMLTSTALVLLMTPALAFFYGGLVRSTNVLNTMMMSFIALAFVGVAWAVIGYSLAFSPGSSWLGGLSRLFLRGVDLEPEGTIPRVLHMSYQGTFAIITAALISGAIVERMRFSAYVVFITLWSVLVYAPVAHWVWGGGWRAAGRLDAARPGPREAAHGRGSRHGHRRGPGGGDTGGRVCQPDECAAAGYVRGADELFLAHLSLQDL